MFEGFCFDVELQRLLQQDGTGVWTPVAVGSRALDVLEVLLRQPGELVTKDAFMKGVWPGIAVEANNLPVQITALRKVLDGRRTSESCIRTVPGRGYRFAAPVTQLTEELRERIVRHPKPPSGSVMLAQSGGLGAPEGHERPVHGFIPSDLPSNRRALSTLHSSGGSPLTETGPAEPVKNCLVTPPAERRQITVLACEAANSAVLSGRLDPEDLHEVTTASHRCCADIIERYHGYVANYSADGMLAYFGFPQADEHDADRAIRAALALVEALPKLRTAVGVPVHVGVGIATGMVVASRQVGSNAVQTITAVGATPNLAARLRALASADEIFIAASTRRLIGSAFELTDLGELDLKGIAEPVHAWRVERARVTESRFDASRGGSALTPLVGRKEELDLLLRRWSQAKDGEGQVVLLSGEPGIGKSRILSTLRERLDAEGVQALRFQCSPYYVNSAFWPLIDNFERTLKFSRDEPWDAKLNKLEALVVTHYGRKLTDVRFVATILSIPYGARYGSFSLTPQKHKDETLRTLVDLIEAAARQRPSVMLFEDAHWADPSTLEVLDLLIDRVRAVPLLVILTHRSEFRSRWSEQGHVGALNLSKLTQAQSVAMVSTLAGGKALPGALLQQILTRTDGVPLFVEELIKSILESGSVERGRRSLRVWRRR